MFCAAQERLKTGIKPPLQKDPAAAMAEALQPLGEAMRGEERIDLALGYLRMAQHLDEDNELISFSLAQLLGQRERFVAAAEQFAEIDE